MRFCGLGPGDAVPDANTLWDFREALIAAGALERLFARLDRAISDAGYLPMSGQIIWQNDCLGDTYDIAPAGAGGDNASHQHDCTAVDGWPDTNPRVRWQKAGASYSHATGIQTKNDAYGWASQYGYLGTPNAALLHWYPNFAFGAYTSSGQAAWAVDTSSDGQWVVYGGEFPRVNNVAQQGLVRFRTRAGAPNTSGPTYSTTPATPTPTTTAVSFAAGEARVSFGSAWDMDDQELTYDILRNNTTWVQTGVKAKSKYGPTNGISAPQIPSNTSRNPLAAPRLRGMRRRLPRVSNSVMMPPLTPRWVPQTQRQ